MPFALSDRHINDATFQWWGGPEAAGSFGAGPAADPGGGDAFDHEGVDLGDFQAPATLPNTSKTGYRTFNPPVQGAYDPVALRFGLLAIPNSGAASAPDYGHFFQAGGFGDGTGGIYTRQLDPRDSAWLWGASRDGHAGHAFAGVVTTQIGLGFDRLARWDFQCMAAKGSTVYYTTLAAAGVAAATSLTLPTSCGWSVPSGGAPCWIKVNGATVHKVTAYNPTTGVATISPAVPGGGYPIGAEVTPYFPARTVSAENPVAEHLCSLDLNAGAEEILATRWNLTVKTGVELREKEGHSQWRRGVVSRRVTDAAQLTADVVMTLDKVKLHGYLRDLTSKDVLLTLGPPGGRRFTVDGQVGKVIKFPPVEGPDGPRVGTMTLGLFSPSGDDVAFTFV